MVELLQFRKELVGVRVDADFTWRAQRATYAPLELLRRGLDQSRLCKVVHAAEHAHRRVRCARHTVQSELCCRLANPAAQPRALEHASTERRRLAPSRLLESPLCPSPYALASRDACP